MVTQAEREDMADRVCFWNEVLKVENKVATESFAKFLRFIITQLLEEKGCWILSTQVDPFSIIEIACWSKMVERWVVWCRGGRIEGWERVGDIHEESSGSLCAEDSRMQSQKCLELGPSPAPGPRSVVPPSLGPVCLAAPVPGSVAWHIITVGVNVSNVITLFNRCYHQSSVHANHNRANSLPQFYRLLALDFARACAERRRRPRGGPLQL